jgi:catalase (peroxidase I)
MAQGSALPLRKTGKAMNLNDLRKFINKLNEIQSGLSKKVSIADLIVLGGSAAIEKPHRKRE